jgi:hypothetical protein
MNISNDRRGEMQSFVLLWAVLDGELDEEVELHYGLFP